jgi:hypothetical protein
MSGSKQGVYTEAADGYLQNIVYFIVYSRFVMII